jgi:hypothetical protein
MIVPELIFGGGKNRSTKGKHAAPRLIVQRSRVPARTASLTAMFVSRRASSLVIETTMRPRIASGSDPSMVTRSQPIVTEAA